MSTPLPYHIPVLLQESIDALSIKPDGFYIDATYGGGGHSAAILEKLGPNGRLLAFDQDIAAQANLIADERLIFVDQNFRFISEFARFHKLEKFDGILADLGVSSHQLDEADRGFSFKFSDKLDMRMDQSSGIDAAHLLNNLEESELARVFYEFGELTNSRAIAKAIALYRLNKQFETVEDLKQALKHIYKGDKEHKFYAKLFQAIRIEINEEITVLKQMLLQTLDLLKPQGRLVVIAYHSLEDRLVKNLIKKGNFEGKSTSRIVSASPWSINR